MISTSVTLHFEHSPTRASERDYFEIFGGPRENQLARGFFVRFGFCCSFSFPNVGSVLCIYEGI